MLKINIQGNPVIYDALDDARQASKTHGGLSFWRETVSHCNDEAFREDFLMELVDNGSEQEAETCNVLCKNGCCTRWVLMSLVLHGFAGVAFAEAVQEACRGQVCSLINLLQQALGNVDGADTELIRSELDYWNRRRQANALYRVFDLTNRNIPVEYLDDIPVGGWTEVHKTSKLVARQIPAGFFTMGSPIEEEGRSENEYPHRVQITRPYYIGIFPITQRQWWLVANTSPALNRGDALPVEQISYYDIRGSATGSRWPNSKEIDKTCFLARIRELTGCMTFDLPTEAQWEYACRAETGSPYCWGNTLNGDRANCNGKWPYGTCERGLCRNSSSEVGMYNPNNWGVYDMHGNVWEWCLDWDDDYGNLEADPVGAYSGEKRIIRGGSWKDFASTCRAAQRASYAPGCRYDDVGFRIVC